MSSTPTSRIVGIDVIKILAMLMICVLHTNNMSDAVHLNPARGEGNYPLCVTVWELTSISSMAVNLYALATGFLCCRACWRISRYLEIWAQVAFYTLIGFLAAACLARCNVAGFTAPTIEAIKNACLPIPLASAYWYFTAYSFLFLLIPFLNKIVEHFDKRALISLLLLCTVIFPLFNPSDHLFLGTGYNVMWLSLLYLCGAILRLHPLKLHPAILISVIILMNASIGIGLLTDHFALMNYSSLPVALMSIATFSLLLNIKVRSQAVCNILRWGSVLSFGVYLVHMHPAVNFFLRLHLSHLLTQGNAAFWIPPLSALAVFLASMAIDALRYGIFHLCRAGNICRWAGDGLTSLHTKLMNRCDKYFGARESRPGEP